MPCHECTGSPRDTLGSCAHRDLTLWPASGGEWAGEGEGERQGEGEMSWRVSVEGECGG